MQTRRMAGNGFNLVNIKSETLINIDLTNTDAKEIVITGEAIYPFTSPGAILFQFCRKQLSESFNDWVAQVFVVN